MDKKFLFELITPSQTLVSNNFDMVVVPGKEGDFGVLENHSNFISQIRPGILQTYNNNKVDREFLVYDGVAEVTSEKLIVLCETACDKNKFNLNKEKENIKNLQKKQNQAKDDTEALFIENEIKKINEIIELVS